MATLPSSPAPQHSEEKSEITYLEGPRHTLRVTRKATKDRQDGTIMLGFEASPEEIPLSYQSSPSGSLWRIGFPKEDESGSECPAITVCRHDIADGKNGRVILRFITIPGRTPPQTFWGASGKTCTITLSSLAGQHPFPHFIDRAERMSVLKRISLLCAEPEFQKWISEQAVKANYPRIPIPTPEFRDDSELGIATAKEYAAAENTCRIALIDSRRDVLTSARAAERVENIIRTWRSTLKSIAQANQYR